MKYLLIAAFLVTGCGRARFAINKPVEEVDPIVTTDPVECDITPQTCDCSNGINISIYNYTFLQLLVDLDYEFVFVSNGDDGQEFDCSVLPPGLATHCENGHFVGNNQ